MGENAKVILDFRKLISDFSHYYFWKNKNRKCPIDAHYHCHRRRDLRFTKDCIEFPTNSRCLWAQRAFFLKGPSFLSPSLYILRLLFWPTEEIIPVLWNLKFSGFIQDSSETPRILYSPWRILRSFLQWRWQWASIGHFVFLFLHKSDWNKYIKLDKWLCS